MTDRTSDFDIAIIGSGMIGSCLALGLSELSRDAWRIALIDPYQDDLQQSTGFDARAIALSYGSTRILDGLNLWQAMSKSSTAISQIEVSDRGHSGITRLNAEKEGVPFLGKVIELYAAGNCLHKAIKEQPGIEPVKESLSDIAMTENGALLKVGERELTAKLVLACDGANSKTRELIELELKRRSYEQMAFVSTVSTQLSHEHRAFERFTEHGPLALLPLSDDRLSLVWTLPPELAKAYADKEQFSDEQLLDQLQKDFGMRLGRFTRIGQRAVFPLALTESEALSKGPVLMLGNAAQSLHPIAGQGFNLGLRDVATLLDVLCEAALDDEGYSQEEKCKPLSELDIEGLLTQYAELRASDRGRVMLLTDALARLFANPSPIISLPRNLVLHALNLAPEGKRVLARQAMGLAGWQPRLVRGLSLTTRAPHAREPNSREAAHG